MTIKLRGTGQTRTGNLVPIYLKKNCTVLMAAFNRPCPRPIMPALKPSMTLHHKLSLPEASRHRSKTSVLSSAFIRQKEAFKSIWRAESLFGGFPAGTKRRSRISLFLSSNSSWVNQRRTSQAPWAAVGIISRSN